VTKQEFVDAVADKSGLSKRDAGAAVDAALAVIEGTLQNGGYALQWWAFAAMTLVGYGYLARRQARESVTPERETVAT